MKYVTLLAFVFTGLLLSSRPLIAEVAVNSGDLQLAVIFTGTTNPSPIPDSLIGCYLKSLNTNRAFTIAYEPDASYFYLADLFDTNGVAVHKTALGQRAGSHFNILDPEVGVKDSHLVFDTFRSSGHAAHFEYSGNEIEAIPRTMLKTTGDITSCSHQASILEGFEIIIPGEYVLRLRFQVFELTDNKAIKLVRFPPIEVKITVTSQDLTAGKVTVVHENVPPSASASAFAHAQAVPPLQVKSSKLLNTTHPTLAFAGYDSPDSALESWIWACFHGDKTNMLQSLTPEEQEDYKHAFDGKTDAQIKDVAAKIGSQFSGYTVQKMDIVSDTQAILNYTFAGSDILLKMVINKIGNEWKIAGPSPDSAVISVSVPSRRTDAENH